MHGFFLGLLGLALLLTLIYFIVVSIVEKISNVISWKNSRLSVKKRRSGAEKIDKLINTEVKVIRKTGKTVYSKGWSSGVLALHDNGKITVNASFKHLIHDLEYRRYGDYYSIQNPTEKDKQVILDRLYS